MSTSVSSQTKEFTLNDLLSGGDKFWSLRPENKHTQWWGEVPVETTSDEVFDLNTGRSIVTVAKLNQMAGSSVVQSAHNLSFPMGKEPIVDIQNPGMHMLLNFETGQKEWEVTLPKEAQNLDFSKASRNTAYTIKGNLYIADATGKQIQVSEDGSIDGSENIVYGTSVHRDEFGIYKGTFWSKDGKQLAYYRMDQSMVPSYPQVDIKYGFKSDGTNGSRIAASYTDHYPMAGETSHHVKVGVYNVETGKNIFLQLEGAEDDYHTNISWAPDGKSIYVFELNRDQNNMRLVEYSTEDGRKMRTVLQETHPKYVEPLHPLVFLPWDDNCAIMQSQRDGYNHFYLLDLKKILKDPSFMESEEGGKSTDYVSVKQLTCGNWVVQKMIGFNEISKSIIYLSNENDPRTSCLYTVRASGGKRYALGDQMGVHYQTLLNDRGSQILDAYTAPDVPRSINLLSTTTGKGKNLLTAKDSWKEADFNIPEISSGDIKAADGKTKLYYRMVKPVNFDPNKKYPTIVYVYGGPHAHNVEASWHWCMRGWEAYMAQKGYLLFILDNRGSEWRGREFEQATFRQLGVKESEDQFEGIKYLKSLPYVDADKIGVHGWSFGGYMTINMMLTYPETFKVGVAGGPVIDWNYYEVMYGERYMDTPQTNPDGYEKCNLRNRATNLKGRLQIIAGYNDPTCVPQHSLSFLRACEDAGTQPDYFVYPGDGHNMFGKDMIHLHERITRYFEDYLK